MMTMCGAGRLTSDPELRTVKRRDNDSETCVCDFSLAVNEFRNVGGERKKFSHFFDFVIWDKAAQLIARECKKGDEIQIKATPRLDRWEDADGNKRSRVIFRVDEFDFGRKSRKNMEASTESDFETEEEPF